MEATSTDKKGDSLYSREKIIQVLVFLTHHRVPNKGATSCRPPTQTEAAQWLKIPQQIFRISGESGMR